MNEPGRLKYTITLALVIAAIFLIPPVRSIALFILPLGTGIDDLVVWAALGSAGILLGLHQIGKINLDYQRRRAVFVFILLVAAITAVLISVVSSS